MNKLNFLWAIPAVLLFSFVIGALGSTTTNYECKYINSIEVKVADHEKYADAVYIIHYNDGTVGAANSFGEPGPRGADRGAVCKTVLEWGWPYSWTNRNVINKNSIKE